MSHDTISPVKTSINVSLLMMAEGHRHQSSYSSTGCVHNRIISNDTALLKITVSLWTTCKIEITLWCLPCHIIAFHSVSLSLSLSLSVSIATVVSGPHYLVTTSVVACCKLNFSNLLPHWHPYCNDGNDPYIQCRVFTWAGLRSVQTIQ